MMNRTDILEKMKTFPYDRSQYWLITGAAMVLYGIREQTHDIDMGCTTVMADQLEEQGCLYGRNSHTGSRWFKINEDIEVFENWLCGTVETVEGIPVISIAGLLEMKKQLGREKDLRDIELINGFLKEEKQV